MYELRRLENISNKLKNVKIAEITGTTLSILLVDNIYILMNDGVLYYYEFELIITRQKYRGRKISFFIYPRNQLTTIWLDGKRSV